PLPGSMPTRPRRAALRAGHRGQPPMAGAFGKHSGAVSRARRTPRPYVFRKKEAPGGFEPPNRGFADLCLTTWLRGRGGVAWNLVGRAGNRTRTGDLLHGKQTLYQLSYS